MPNLSSNPAFVAYAVAILVLALNLLFLWSYSGVVRGRTRTTPNPEDARSPEKGTKVVEGEPPEVARVLRAYANAAAAVLPFAALGLVYVLAGGGGTAAAVMFGVFAGARVVHSLVYLAGKQPWRSIAFGVGVLATFALMVSIVRILVAA